MDHDQDSSARALHRIRIEAIGARKLELTGYVYKRTGGIIESGPFRGLKLAPLVSHGFGDLAAMLLGFYEQELGPAIERAAETGYDLVVNIGAAEGYYAVGLARLMPQSRVIAIEANANAHDICRRNAEENGVGSRIEIRGRQSADELQETLQSARSAFLLVDCEGCELELLNPQSVPALDRSDIIVECHDFIDRRTTGALRERFDRTHDIELIEQGGRNPNASKHLRRMNETDRWLLISEGRPETMHWLAMVRR
jgi:hypothetical protein